MTVLNKGRTKHPAAPPRNPGSSFEERRLKGVNRVLVEGLEALQLIAEQTNNVSLYNLIDEILERAEEAGAIRA